MFLTIELPDAQDVKLNLKPEGHFNFSAKGSDDLRYEFDIELFDAVNVEVCLIFNTTCFLLWNVAFQFPIVSVLLFG